MIRSGHRGVRADEDKASALDLNASISYFNPTTATPRNRPALSHVDHGLTEAAQRFKVEPNCMQQIVQTRKSLCSQFIDGRDDPQLRYQGEDMRQEEGFDPGSTTPDDKGNGCVE